MMSGVIAYIIMSLIFLCLENKKYNKYKHYNNKNCRDARAILNMFTYKSDLEKYKKRFK